MRILVGVATLLVVLPACANDDALTPPESNVDSPADQGDATEFNTDPDAPSETSTSSPTDVSQDTTDSPFETTGEPDFVVDNPNLDQGDYYDDTGGDEVADDDVAEDVPPPEPSPDDDDKNADDIIAEADIIQIEGDTLYALSRLSGLTVIDISNPADMEVLGAYRTRATPFEMYVENGRAFVMFFDFWSRQWDEEGDSYRWVQDSSLLSLNAQDPSNIQVEGEFHLPGQIQDSRRIGDRLYLVTYENGWCWRCDDNPNTTITSLDISNRKNVVEADQLQFPGTEGSHGGGMRSVMATSDRMYVGGREYSWGDEDGRSTIDVVDVSDPSGKLVKGDSVKVAGSINSRWQMNEYDDVLRVISQPNDWRTDDPPRCRDV